MIKLEREIVQWKITTKDLKQDNAPEARFETAENSTRKERSEIEKNNSQTAENTAKEARSETAKNCTRNARSEIEKDDSKTAKNTIKKAR
jgi:hypothetical protein